MRTVQKLCHVSCPKVHADFRLKVTGILANLPGTFRISSGKTFHKTILSINLPISCGGCSQMPWPSLVYKLAS